jgi:hypothetical protein
MKEIEQLPLADVLDLVCMFSVRPQKGQSSFPNPTDRFVSACFMVQHHEVYGQRLPPLGFKRLHFVVPEPKGVSQWACSVIAMLSSDARTLRPPYQDPSETGQVGRRVVNRQRPARPSGSRRLPADLEPGQWILRCRPQDRWQPAAPSVLLLCRNSTSTRFVPGAWVLGTDSPQATWWRPSWRPATRPPPPAS